MTASKPRSTTRSGWTTRKARKRTRTPWMRRRLTHCQLHFGLAELRLLTTSTRALRRAAQPQLPSSRQSSAIVRPRCHNAAERRAASCPAATARTMSARVTIPAIAPFSAVTTTRLILCFSMTRAISSTVASAGAVTTGWTMSLSTQQLPASIAARKFSLSGSPSASCASHH